MLKFLTVAFCACQSPRFSQPVEVTYFLSRERVWLSRCNTHRKLNCAELITPGVAVKMSLVASCFTYNAVPRDDTVYAIFI